MADEQDDPRLGLPTMAPPGGSVAEPPPGSGSLRETREGAEARAPDTDQLRVGAEEMPLPGTPYRLKRRLAGGGMGAVFVGEHVELGREVAIKLLAPQLAGDAGAMERLRREARAMARIGHPNIVDVYDLGVSADGQPFVAMRLVDGRNLAELLAREGPLPLERVAGLIDQIAGALEAVHRLGIVHRDLKPENVMVERVAAADRVSLLDFGIAHAAMETADSRLTREGQVVGTPGYMAPEQALGRPTDGRADQYSLAVIAYELLSGQSPYERVTPLQIIAAQLTREPRPLAESVDSQRVPPAAQAVVMRGMAREPGDRFETVAVFAAAFRAALAVPTAQVPPPRPRARWPFLVGGLVVAVLVGRFVMLRLDRPSSPHAPEGARGAALQVLALAETPEEMRAMFTTPPAGAAADERLAAAPTGALGAPAAAAPQAGGAAAAAGGAAAAAGASAAAAPQAGGAAAAAGGAAAAAGASAAAAPQAGGAAAAAGGAAAGTAAAAAGAAAAAVAGTAAAAGGTAAAPPQAPAGARALPAAPPQNTAAAPAALSGDRAAAKRTAREAELRAVMGDPWGRSGPVDTTRSPAELVRRREAIERELARMAMPNASAGWGFRGTADVEAPQTEPGRPLAPAPPPAPTDEAEPSRRPPGQGLAAVDHARPAAAPRPTPPAGSARIDLADVRVSGGTSRNEVEQAVRRTLERVRGCASACSAGDEARVSLTIDEDGFFTSIQGRGHPQIARCAAQALDKGRLRRRPDTGDVMVELVFRASAR